MQEPEHVRHSATSREPLRGRGTADGARGRLPVSGVRSHSVDAPRSNRKQLSSMRGRRRRPVTSTLESAANEAHEIRSSQLRMLTSDEIRQLSVHEVTASSQLKKKPYVDETGTCTVCGKRSCSGEKMHFSLGDVFFLLRARKYVTRFHSLFKTKSNAKSARPLMCLHDGCSDRFKAKYTQPDARQCAACGGAPLSSFNIHDSHISATYMDGTSEKLTDGMLYERMSSVPREAYLEHFGGSFCPLDCFYDVIPVMSTAANNIMSTQTKDKIKAVVRFADGRMFWAPEVPDGPQSKEVPNPTCRLYERLFTTVKKVSNICEEARTLCRLLDMPEDSVKTRPDVHRLWPTVDARTQHLMTAGNDKIKRGQRAMSLWKAEMEAEGACGGENARQACQLLELTDVEITDVYRLWPTIQARAEQLIAAGKDEVANGKTAAEAWNTLCKLDFKDYEKVLKDIKMLIFDVPPNANAAAGNNMDGGNPSSADKVRSIMANVQGKYGDFTRHYKGKQVNSIGRAVVAPGPNLKIYQIGVPIHMAVKYDVHTPVSPFTRHRILKNVYEKGCPIKYVKRKNGEQVIGFVPFAELRDGDELCTGLYDGCPVLVNRQPTLWQKSMQAFEAVILWNAPDIRCLLFHPQQTEEYAMDFDGDCGNLQVTFLWFTMLEAVLLMSTAVNSLNGSAFTSCIGFKQDTLAAIFDMTHKDRTYTMKTALEILRHTKAAPPVLETYRARLMKLAGTTRTLMLHDHQLAHAIVRALGLDPGLVNELYATGQWSGPEIDYQRSEVLWCVAQTKTDLDLCSCFVAAYKRRHPTLVDDKLERRLSQLSTMHYEHDAQETWFSVRFTDPLDANIEYAAFHVSRSELQQVSGPVAREWLEIEVLHNVPGICLVEALLPNNFRPHSLVDAEGRIKMDKLIQRQIYGMDKSMLGRGSNTLPHLLQLEFDCSTASEIISSLMFMVYYVSRVNPMSIDVRDICLDGFLTNSGPHRQCQDAIKRRKDEVLTELQAKFDEALNEYDEAVQRRPRPVYVKEDVQRLLMSCSNFGYRNPEFDQFCVERAQRTFDFHRDVMHHTPQTMWHCELFTKPLARGEPDQLAMLRERMAAERYPHPTTPLADSDAHKLMLQEMQRFEKQVQAFRTEMSRDLFHEHSRCVYANRVVVEENVPSLQEEGLPIFNQHLRQRPRPPLRDQPHYSDNPFLHIAICGAKGSVNSAYPMAIAQARAPRLLPPHLEQGLPFGRPFVCCPIGLVSMPGVRTLVTPIVSGMSAVEMAENRRDGVTRLAQRQVDLPKSGHQSELFTQVLSLAVVDRMLSTRIMGHRIIQVITYGDGFDPRYLVLQSLSSEWLLQNLTSEGSQLWALMSVEKLALPFCADELLARSAGALYSYVMEHCARKSRVMAGELSSAMAMMDVDGGYHPDDVEWVQTVEVTPHPVMRHIILAMLRRARSMPEDNEVRVWSLRAVVYERVMRAVIAPGTNVGPQTATMLAQQGQQDHLSSHRSVGSGKKTDETDQQARALELLTCKKNMPNMIELQLVDKSDAAVQAFVQSINPRTLRSMLRFDEPFMMPADYPMPRKCRLYETARLWELCYPHSLIVHIAKALTDAEVQSIVTQMEGWMPRAFVKHSRLVVFPTYRAAETELLVRAAPRPGTNHRVVDGVVFSTRVLPNIRQNIVLGPMPAVTKVQHMGNGVIHLRLRGNETRMQHTIKELRKRPEVDFSSVCPTNPMYAQRCYGILGGAVVLLRELQKTMGGRLAARHIEMLVDWMRSRGVLLPPNTSGMNEAAPTGIPAIMAERAGDNLYAAVVRRQRDTSEHPMVAHIFGTESRYGTKYARHGLSVAMKQPDTVEYRPMPVWSAAYSNPYTMPQPQRPQTGDLSPEYTPSTPYRPSSLSPDFTDGSPFREQDEYGGEGSGTFFAPIDYELPSQ